MTEILNSPNKLSGLLRSGPKVPLLSLKCSGNYRIVETINVLAVTELEFRVRQGLKLLSLQMMMMMYQMPPTGYKKGW